MRFRKTIKAIVAFCVTGTYLYAASPKPLTEFELAHKEEIVAIIKKYEAEYPDNYLAQKYWIKSDIESLQKLEEIKTQYGLKK